MPDGHDNRDRHDNRDHRDNPPPASSRLFDVADRERTLENLVRRSLADQAGAANAGKPSHGDLAGAAISRARRRHRRRTVLALGSVVMATVLATGAWFQGWHAVDQSPEFGAVSGFLGDSSENPTPQPESTVRLATDEQLARTLPADLVGAGADGGLVLAPASGDAIVLPGVRDVVAAQRLGDGWAVVSGQGGTQRLWWVSANQAPVSVLAGADAIALSGQQVSWQRGSLLSTAVLSSGGELGPRVSTGGLRDGVRPVGFVGEAVLLARSDPGSAKAGRETRGGQAPSADAWDIWHPQQGDYRPGGNHGVTRVFGALPGQDAAVGLVPEEPGADRWCFARLGLTPVLAVEETRCPASPVADSLAANPAAAISPDGRWLVTGGQDPLLVDLAELFAVPISEAVHEVPVAQRVAATPTWLGTDRVVLPADDRLLQVWPARVATQERSAVQESPLTGPAPVIVATG